MKFTVERAAFLKAVQSLQTRAAAQDSLAYLSDVLLRTTDDRHLELSAENVLGDTKVTVNAHISETGADFISVRRLSEVLRKAKAETMQLTKATGGQVRIECGEKVYLLDATHSEASAPIALVESKRRRKVTSSLSISILLHLIFAFIVALTIKNQLPEEEDRLIIDFVEVSSSSVRRMKKPRTKRIQPRVNLTKSFKPSNQPRVDVSTPTQIAETARQPLTSIRQNIDFAAKVPDAIGTSVTTAARIPVGPRDLNLSAPRNVEGGTTRLLTENLRAPSRGNARSAGITSMVESTGAVDSADLSGARFTQLIMVPENRLGAILVGEGTDVQGHIRLIRLKHSLSDWWQDPTAIPSFMNWLGEHTRLRADMRFEGGALSMTDPRILDAPLIFMTGHDKDITVGRNLVKGGPLTNSFTSDERAALRKYIVERGGMLFFDDCGFNGLFAQIVANELEQIFPEYPLELIMHNHEIYSIYYQLSVPPTGGDVFWGSENNPKASKFKYQKGITIGRRLAVVYNRKDYMCAMETAEIASRTMLRMRRSSDVHRFMTNLLFYAMKYGDNVDRSAYKP